MFNQKQIQNDFPLLRRRINGKRIVYLDSTASSLKPQSVIDAVSKYNSDYSVNIFRGVYTLSHEATQAHEEAREAIASFIECTDSREIIFVRNATEALNLVMYSYGKKVVKKDDEIVCTLMEHHANFVTWQQLAKERNACITYVPFESDFTFSIQKIVNALSSKTKILAITHVSNVLGTINPVKEIIARVKKKYPHIIVVVDGAQAAPHMKVDVLDLGCDFYAFSGHKMLGPTGIGVLWGKYKLLDRMDPFLFGGEMIKMVQTEDTVFQTPPYKFEAGTPDISGAIGLAAAVKYLSRIGMDAVRHHEKEIMSYAMKKLQSIPGLVMYGPNDPQIKGGVVAFSLGKIHPHDVASILDRDNICIRTGHHCAMPLHTYLKLGATCRASFYVYNTKYDVDALVSGLENVLKMFSTG